MVVSQNPNKTVLVTFGAGTRGWRTAADRVVRDAKRLDIFSEVQAFDSAWLKRYDQDLWKIVRNFFEKELRRGYGYWMWKPALLKWADEKWPDCQILYVDAGFEIGAGQYQSDVFKDFLNESWIRGGIAFEQLNLPEINWTKCEIFEYLNVDYDNRFCNQLFAGFICMPPGNQRKKLLQEFYNLTKVEQGFLFSDELRKKQDSSLIETRHDQSIFSILWRKYNLYTTADLTNQSNRGNFLFTASRNRTGISSSNPKFLLKLLRGFNKVIDLFLLRD
jgi:hypothetical protein